MKCDVCGSDGETLAVCTRNSDGITVEANVCTECLDSDAFLEVPCS
jgi:hypothetical protein